MDFFEAYASVVRRALEDYAGQLHEMATREECDGRPNTAQILEAEADLADEARRRMLKMLTKPTR